jgi:hypothetical protein
MRTEVALLLVLAGCAGGVAQFPLQEPMWRDDDAKPFSPRPARFRSAELWNTLDNSIFRPISRVLAVRGRRSAVNVNSLDEVPDSSWFVNRIGQRAMGKDELQLGACAGVTFAENGPWTVIGGKPNGVNPGFLVSDAAGHKYLMKLDGQRQGERSTAADVIGSLVYHAAGYFVPCNRVIFFDGAGLLLSPSAMAEDFVGDDVPFTRELLDATLARSRKHADGRVRAMVSRLLPGKPIGPWSDTGVREDDPNDVIPHQDRRELRGSLVLAAWLDRYDSREQNALDMWIDVGGGQGYVKHHFIDFSDGLGSLSAWQRVSRRRGHAYEFGLGLFFEELVTLGTLDRPWHHARLGPTGYTLGYWDDGRFVAEAWRTAYPYGPFEHADEADAAWGARILARLGRAEIEWIVDGARLEDPVTRSEVVRILLGRREKLLRRYLGKRSPLTGPRLIATQGGDKLCVRDLWLEAGLTNRAGRRITASVGGKELTVNWDVGADVCAVLPGAREARGEYVVVRWTSNGQRPMDVHVRSGQVVGLERR